MTLLLVFGKVPLMCTEATKSWFLHLTPPEVGDNGGRQTPTEWLATLVDQQTPTDWKSQNV